VELYILTKPFLSGSNFVGDMHKWARENLNITQVSAYGPAPVPQHLCLTGVSVEQCSLAA
jgi:hypothetical protein